MKRNILLFYTGTATPPPSLPPPPPPRRPVQSHCPPSPPTRSREGGSLPLPHAPAAGTLHRIRLTTLFLTPHPRLRTFILSFLLLRCPMTHLVLSSRAIRAAALA